MKENQKGFSHGQVLLIVLVIVIIGLVGWRVWHRHHSNDPASGQTSSAGSASSTNPSSNSSQPPGLSFAGRQRFGVATGAEIFNDSDSDFKAQMQGIHDMGAAWIRSTISWKGTEKSKGVYNWSGADRLVNTASSLGLHMIAGINQNPSWSKASSNYGCSDQPNPNFSIEDYASYAKALVTRYHSKVKVWELGNEPNHVKGVWTHPNACQYTELLKQTYKAIKSVDPNATVLIGGIGGTKDANGDLSGSTFASALYAAGAKPYFDGISYHPYSYPDSPKTPARGWAQMLEVRRTMEKYGDSSKKIWATEFGAPVGPYQQQNGKNFNGLTEAGQAQLVRDAYQVFSGYSWSGPLCWFAYRDHQSGPKLDKHMGLVSSSYVKRQAWYTYQGLAKAQ